MLLVLLVVVLARLAAGVNITVRVAGVEQPGDCKDFLGRLEVGIISSISVFCMCRIV